MNTADRLKINERAHTAQDVVDQIGRVCPTCQKPDPGICTGCPEYPNRMHCGCRHTRTKSHRPMHDDRYNIVKTSPDDQPPEHDPRSPWIIIHPRIHGQNRSITRCRNWRHAIAIVLLLVALDGLAES